ncbi:MAG: pilus assembly protein N-terminal domain-containing protein [Pirellulales bacterium]
MAAFALAPTSLYAQLGADLPTPADQKKLERPSEMTLMKESSLIEEVLQPELIFRLSPQRSKILRTRVPVTRIAITNPAMVDVNEFGPNEFELIGLQAGETTMTMWFQDENGGVRRLRYLVQVAANESELLQAEYEYGKLEHRINELFPNSQIRLIPLADKLIVRGQPRDSREAAEILAILTGGSGSGGQGGLNGGAGGLTNAGGALRLPGAPNIVMTNVINLMNVPGEQQILLKVRVAEITRSALRESGFGFNVDTGNWSVDLGTLSSGANIAAILSGGEYSLFMKAFASNGYGKILAEPTLVTLNGQPANFMAGGEFAVPTAVGVQGVSAVATFFKGFGTQLSFLPVILDKDRVRLTVSPTFSSLGGGEVNGIPTLNTRSVHTTVDLREGQWLAVAGLIQDEQSGSRGRIPFIGDIPMIGGLFGTHMKKRDETELVVLVSPELVHPLEKEQAPIILPGMDVTDPTDCAFFFFQQYEGVPSTFHRSTLWPTVKQHILLESWKSAHAQRKGTHTFADEQSFYVKGPSGLSE